MKTRAAFSGLNLMQNLFRLANTNNDTYNKMFGDY